MKSERNMHTLKKIDKIVFELIRLEKNFSQKQTHFLTKQNLQKFCTLKKKKIEHIKKQKSCKNFDFKKKFQSHSFLKKNLTFFALFRIKMNVNWKNFAHFKKIDKMQR